MLAAAPASAQGKYPSRPIRVMLPFAAGSCPTSRSAFSPTNGARPGTSIIVEAQPRAGGTTAALAAQIATADGYTLVTFPELDRHQRIAAEGPTVPRSDWRFPADLGHQHLRQHHRGRAARTTGGSRNSWQPRATRRLQHRHHHGRIDQHLAANLLKSSDRPHIVIVPFHTPGDLLTAVLRERRRRNHQSYGALKSAVESENRSGRWAPPPRSAPPTRPISRRWTRPASKASTS